MEFGVTAIEAVGAGAGGGGGGGGGATFFLQAPSVMIAPRMTTSVNHFMRCCFTLYSSCGPQNFPFKVRRSDFISNSNWVGYCVLRKSIAEPWSRRPASSRFLPCPSGSTQIRYAVHQVTMRANRYARHHG